MATRKKAPQGTAETVQAPKKAPQSTELGAAMEVQAANGLNLRQGPAYSYSVKGRLAPGERVQELPLPEGIQVPDWSPVETSLGRGWVQTEFLRVVPQEGR